MKYNISFKISGYTIIEEEANSVEEAVAKATNAVKNVDSGELLFVNSEVYTTSIARD